MAYVAFDLDSTLGFFEVTNPLAYFWSPEWLNNPEQSAVNRRLELSSKLHVKLAKARAYFANSLLTHPDVLFLVLRPNLNVVFEPLLAAKRNRKLKSVIIYSNTSVMYSIELAKYLIEKRFKAPGLISLMVDHWHPLRNADRHTSSTGVYVQPEKTLQTLRVLFRTATKSNVTPPTNKIMFMDDRRPKHKLQEQEAEGLTYIVPSAFYPKVTELDKKLILLLALQALQKAELLSDHEYLNSGFCYRTIPYDYTKRYRVYGFLSLFNYVWRRMQNVTSNTDWKSDTDALQARVQEFLEKV
ncbi:hypothetical protein EBR66_05135 [bacterium]|nr:hypothetical protein [bacterium]